MNKPVIMIDFGGVYFTTARYAVTDKFSKKFNMPQKKIINALMGSNWTKYATGKSDEKKYWKHISKKLDISKRQTQELRKAFYSYPSLNTGMVDLVKRLKEKYRIVVLSSNIVGWVKFLEKKYKLSEEFHEQHYSFNHGIDKPSARFFLSAAKKMKTKPENCIVIDDNKIFISAVKKTGARTILFKNAKQLEKDLIKLGVEI